MPFDTAWLTEATDVPEEHAALAERLRAFASGPADPDGALALADAPLDGLLALVEVLLRAQDGARLALLKGSGLPKKARKAIGKAIHQLKTRGVDCEVPTSRVGTMGYSLDPLPSLISTPLANGTQILILSDLLAGGGQGSCYAVTAAEGLDELALIEEPSRTRLRRIVKDIEDDHENAVRMTFAEATSEHVRTRLVAALERHRASKTPLPKEYSACRALIEGPQLDGPHPARVRLGATDPTLVRQGHRLLGRVVEDVDQPYEYGAVDRPMLDQEWETEAYERLQKALDSPVVVDDVQRRERVSDELDRIVEATFEPALRATSADRLLDAAFVLAGRGAEEMGRIAIATADALLDESRAVLDIPWARESIRGIVDIDYMLAAYHRGTSDHEHGPDCDHDHHPHDSASAHDHGSGPASDDPADRLILPG